MAGRVEKIGESQAEGAVCSEAPVAGQGRGGQALGAERHSSPPGREGGDWGVGEAQALQGFPDPGSCGRMLKGGLLMQGRLERGFWESSFQRSPLLRGAYGLPWGNHSHHNQLLPDSWSLTLSSLAGARTALHACGVEELDEASEQSREGRAWRPWERWADSGGILGVT